MTTPAQDLNQGEMSGSGEEDPVAARRLRMYEHEGLGFTPGLDREAAAARQAKRLRRPA